MIIKRVDFDSFYKEFLNYDRLDNFSLKGLEALYDYLEELYDDVQYKLDVIELCCTYTELNINDISYTYGVDSLEELTELTSVIYVDDNNIIVSAF